VVKRPVEEEENEWPPRPSSLGRPSSLPWWSFPSYKTNQNRPNKLLNFHAKPRRKLTQSREEERRREEVRLKEGRPQVGFDLKRREEERREGTWHRLSPTERDRKKRDTASLKAQSLSKSEQGCTGPPTTQGMGNTSDALGACLPGNPVAG
jgi:hypothetical protein